MPSPIESPLHERIAIAQLIDEEVQKIIVFGGMKKESYGLVRG
jgi:hypothetical protein